MLTSAQSFCKSWLPLLSVSCGLAGCGGSGPDLPPTTMTHAKINDTGVAVCVDSTQQEVDCSSADSQSGFYGQDGNFGRDAKARTGELNKIGGGSAGFDFTKLDADGSPLADQGRPWVADGAEQWSCVEDNVTGLTWEVKNNDQSTLRYYDLTLSWYDSQAQTNGGNAGMRGTADCLALDICDTETYLAALNAQQLCGRNDWRLPTLNELLSIADQSKTNPPLDLSYFPNSSYNAHWTSNTVASDPSMAWYVYFTAAGNGAINKDGRAHIRAVSSGE